MARDLAERPDGSIDAKQGLLVTLSACAGQRKDANFPGAASASKVRVRRRGECAHAPRSVSGRMPASDAQTGGRADTRLGPRTRKVESARILHPDENAARRGRWQISAAGCDLAAPKRLPPKGWSRHGAGAMLAPVMTITTRVPIGVGQRADRTDTADAISPRRRGRTAPSRAAAVLPGRAASSPRDGRRAAVRERIL
jgi:hypothetical protein